MRVEHKYYYYFEESDKESFKKFLEKNSMSMNDFANNCGMSLTLLSFIINGRRAINQTIIDLFAKNGFEVKIWVKKMAKESI